MSKKKAAIIINYPTWKVRGCPTPNETLMVCDGCGYCQWTTGWSQVSYCGGVICRGRKGGQSRMRKATAKEMAEAKKALKFII